MLSSQWILGSDVEKEEIVPDLIKLNPKGEERHLLFMQTMISSQLCGAREIHGVTSEPKVGDPMQSWGPGRVARALRINWFKEGKGEHIKETD